MAGCTVLVTAHPDDEAMFFGPTILRLIEQGLRVALLCLSTGVRRRQAAPRGGRRAEVASGGGGGGGSGRRRPCPNPA